MKRMQLRYCDTSGMTREVRRFVYRSCLNKVRFATPHHADSVAKYLRKHYGRKLYKYQCTICGGFHHATRQVQDKEPIRTTPKTQTIYYLCPSYRPDCSVLTAGFTGRTLDL